MDLVSTRKKQTKYNDYPINKFIIPFSFDAENYDYICKSLKKEEWILNNKLNSNEFFSHIKQLIEGESDDSICNRYCNKKNRVVILSDKTGDSEFGGIRDIKLYVFKTGIGFYKFSVSYQNVKNIDELILLNNKVKSIEHNNHSIIIEKEISVELKNHMLFEKNEPINVDEIIYALDLTNTKEEVLLKWKYFEGIKRNRKVKITLGKDGGKYVRYTKYTQIDVRDFLNDEIGNQDKITYFNKFDYAAKTKQMSSKANVFVVGLITCNEFEKKIADEQAFLLSRGYKQSYKKSSEIGEDIFSTFDNSIWSVSREGVANLCWLVDDEDTNTFFKSTYLDRTENSFFLYILALHQYYSLIKVSQDISKLPYSFKDYLANEKKYTLLMKIYDQVNYIYLRCIYHEVSHISHEAYFYNKLYEMLGIESLLNEINFEMDRLTGIVNMIKDNNGKENYQRQEREYREIQEQRRKEAEKKAKNEKLFAIIGGIFALFATSETLWNMSRLAGYSKPFVFIGLGILAAWVCGLILYFIVNKSNKNEEKK